MPRRRYQTFQQHASLPASMGVGSLLALLTVSVFAVLAGGCGLCTSTTNYFARLMNPQNTSVPLTFRYWVDDVGTSCDDQNTCPRNYNYYEINLAANETRDILVDIRLRKYNPPGGKVPGDNCDSTSQYTVEVEFSQATLDNNSVCLVVDDQGTFSANGTDRFYEILAMSSTCANGTKVTVGYN